MASLVALLLSVACTAPATAHHSPSPSSSTSQRSAALATGGIVEYSLPDLPAAASGPRRLLPGERSLESLVAGPDGNIWFVDVGRRQVGRITPSGQITWFAMPVQLAGGVRTIAAGPDHNMWVLGRGDSWTEAWILRVGMNGDVTKFRVRETGAGITTGPDGNLWFTESDHIARMTTSGVVTEFPIVGRTHPNSGITSGPDGNLWFAEDSHDRMALGRITTEGMALHALPVAAALPFPALDLITGPDGNIWFAYGGGIGHVSPKGALQSIAVPKGSQPGELAVGPDRNIWFTDRGRDVIGRLSLTGAVREFRLPRPQSGVLGITVGGDGRMWFTEGNRIGSIGLQVPETLLSQRVMIFMDASTKTLTVNNTGDAPLSVGSVRLAGIDSSDFIKNADTCSDRALGAGAKCTVAVAYVGRAVKGVESAVLEIPDDATGSPQRISLVAQLRACTLPLVLSTPKEVPIGAYLDTTHGQVTYELRDRFEVASGVRTTTPPALNGREAGYYDRTAGRWLPVYSPRAVAPDGWRYAYTSSPYAGPSVYALHVVDVRTGHDRMFPLPSGFWGVAGYTAEGIYLNQVFEGIHPGLLLVDPDSGAIRRLPYEDPVWAVTGSTAWIGVHNNADTLPEPPGIGGFFNEIDQRDLHTGAKTTWLYVPGSSLYILAVIAGAPVVSYWDGTGSYMYVVPAPNQAHDVQLPPYEGFEEGFVPDPQGMWVGSPDGIYLWNTRTGPILVSNLAARPAGTCA